MIINRDALSIELRNPILRDQTTDQIATTFWRSMNGKIVPFRHNSPMQKMVSMVFDGLGYKKARELIAFLKATDGLAITFSGVAEFMEGKDTVVGTVVSDPHTMITTHSCARQIAITVCLQDTIHLSGRHRSFTDGNSSGVQGTENSYFLISGETNVVKLNYNTEFARFGDDTPGLWTSREPIPNPGRANSAAFGILGNIYVTGGHDGSNRLDIIHKFTPAFNAGGVWSLMNGRTPTTREDAIAFAMLRKGYVLTGRTNALMTNVATMEEFNNDSWTELNSSPYPQSVRHAMVFVQGTIDENENPTFIKAYVYGGQSNDMSGTPIADVNSFDSVTKVWSSETTGWPIRQEGAGASDQSSNGYFFGGNSGSTPANVINTALPDAYKYNTGTLTWASSIALPVGMKKNCGVALGDAIFSVSGASGIDTASILNKNYEFIEGYGAWIERAPVAVNTDPISDRFHAVAVASYLGGSLTPSDFQVIAPPPPDTPGSYVIVCGGNSFNTAPKLEGFTSINNTYTWDFGAFTTRTALPEPRANHGLAAIGGIGYLMDGVNSRNIPIASIWSFDQSFTWTELPENPISRGRNATQNTRDITCNSGSVSWRDSVYKITGQKGALIKYGDISSQIQRYTPGLGWAVVFNNVSKLSSSTMSACVTKDDDVYIIAGIYDTFIKSAPFAYGNFVQTYNFLGNNTSTRTRLPLGTNKGDCARLQALNIDGTLYSFSAEYGTGLLQLRTLKMDDTDFSWSNLTPSPNLSTAQCGYDAANTSNNLVGAIFGGEEADGTKIANAYTYDSVGDAWSLDSAMGLAASDLATVGTSENLNPTATQDMFVTGGSTGYDMTLGQAANTTSPYENIKTSEAVNPRQPITNGESFVHYISTNSFSRVAANTGPNLTYCAARNIQGKVWMLGIMASLQQYTGNGQLPIPPFNLGVYCYDPEGLTQSLKGSWKLPKQYPTIPSDYPSRNMGSAVINNIMYLCGGNRFKDDNRNTRFNWTDTPDYTAARDILHGEREFPDENNEIQSFDPEAATNVNFRSYAPSSPEPTFMFNETDAQASRQNWMTRGCTINDVAYFVRARERRDVLTFDPSLAIGMRLGVLSGHQPCVQGGVVAPDSAYSTVFIICNGKYASWPNLGILYGSLNEKYDTIGATWTTLGSNSSLPALGGATGDTIDREIFVYPGQTLTEYSRDYIFKGTVTVAIRNANMNNFLNGAKEDATGIYFPNIRYMHDTNSYRYHLDNDVIYNAGSILNVGSTATGRHSAPI